MRRRSQVVTVLVGAVLGVVWAGLAPATASAATDGWAGNRGWVTPIGQGGSAENDPVGDHVDG